MADDDDLLADPLLETVPVYEGYKVLGRAVLYEKLAQGERSAVYKGRHLTLNADVAVRVTAPPADVPAEEAERLVRGLVRAVRRASAVKHENLLRVYEVDSEHGLCFTVTRLVDGESAAERLRRKGRLSDREAAVICRAAAAGLGAAHRRGLVHRDVRPENIFVDKEGKTIVVGLGLSGGSDEGEGKPDDGSARSRKARIRPPRPSRGQARAASSAPPRAGPASGRLLGKDLEFFVRRYVRSPAHRLVLSHLAARGPGPAEPGGIAKSVQLDVLEVRPILEDWARRGFIGSSGPHQYYYSPGQRERGLAAAFQKAWAVPEERERLTAMILRMEKG